jgi:hypothetical protein
VDSQAERPKCSILRALHQALPENACVLDDPLATRVVDGNSQPYQARVAMLARMPGRLRCRFTHYMMRSRYAEDRLAQFVR